MDTRLALMCGTDIPFLELQMTIHEPTMKEISFIGETDFFSGLQCLTVNKKQFPVDNSLLDNTTNFQLFMTIMNQPEAKERKEAVIKLLQLIFPGYNTIITPRSILFNKGEESHIMDENNFDMFQDIIKEIFCIKTGKDDTSSFNPADKKAQEIAAKLMRGRQRVAAQKGEDTGSMFGRYMSIIQVALHISLIELREYTMYMIHDTMERFGLYTNWDLDIRTRLAGGKPDGKPEDWMKNIH